jgi:hypothetical protein
MEFHSFLIKCPQCKQEPTITSVKFSAKGEIRFEMICVVCGIPLFVESSWEQVVIYCSEMSKSKIIIDFPETKH